MSDRDYYEVLGLTPGADGAMVDQAYWHLARKYQMLGTTNPRARNMLDELNEAYGVVGAPDLRQQYDAFRDDVLITRGIIQPVKSRSKREDETSREVPTAGKPRSRRRLPRLDGEHWRTYATSGLITALSLAGAWAGVNPVFVITALVAGLAISLTPELRRHPMPNIEFPAVSMPEIRAPRMSLPRLGEANAARLREFGVGLPKDEPVNPSELHASTAAMITRWRNSVGLRPVVEESDVMPSRTLVDIVDSERDLDEQSESLSAVIDILRGAHRPIGTK